MIKSTSIPTKKKFTKGTNALSGANLTSSEPESLAPGIGEAGGIDHYKNFTRTDIDHSK